jgi:hypothetical protein
MKILVADLDEDAARLRQQLAGNYQPVSKVGEVRVDAKLPRIAVGTDLLRLPGQVACLPILDLTLAR